MVANIQAKHRDCFRKRNEIPLRTSCRCCMHCNALQSNRLLYGMVSDSTIIVVRMGDVSSPINPWKRQLLPAVVLYKRCPFVDRLSKATAVVVWIFADIGRSVRMRGSGVRFDKNSMKKFTENVAVSCRCTNIIPLFVVMSVGTCFF